MKLDTCCELKDWPAEDMFEIVETPIVIKEPLPGNTDGPLEIAKALKHDPDNIGDRAIMSVDFQYLRRPEVDIGEVVSFGSISNCADTTTDTVDVVLSSL
ncbi:hypothetical protein [Halobaculum gomorrense]|uniref:Uncharacterized protein n=1 Tax=Halobaculum gomorrense TaxID=43928 RepID=A0A1M5J924_9EURY|nr:hypothetical protein [Halobaculum gomorrense]SHG37072.1 hypothetical protein SAMN05443636_0003 [Halobaculum gomorrense]